MPNPKGNDKQEPKQSQESSAQPHPRDGHLRLPNYIVERLAKLRLNGTQWQILWAVWRHTLCWQQPGEWRNRPYPISIDDLVDDTGINEYQLKRELGHLIEMNIIHRDNTPGGRGHKPITAFNLDPHTWNVSLNGSEIATLKERVADMTPFTEQKGSGNATPTTPEIEEKGSELVTPSVADSLPFTNRSATLSVPKLKLPKETLNKHLNKQYIVIFDLWNSLNIIHHKKLVDEMRRALKSALGNYAQEEICQAIRNYAEIVESDDYFFKYRWTLKDFLRRGLEKFMDGEVARENYRIGGRYDRQPEKGVRPAPDQERLHPVKRIDGETGEEK